MGIRVKLIITILIVALAGASVGIVGYHSNHLIASSYDIVSNESSPKLFLLSKISNQINRIQAEAISHALLKLTQYDVENAYVSDISKQANEELEQMREASKKLLQYLKSLKDVDCLRCKEEEKKLAYNEIEQTSALFLSLCSKLVAAVDNGKSKVSLAKFKNEMEVIEEVLLKMLTKEIDKEHGILKKRMEIAADNASYSNRLILLITGLAVFLTIVMGALLANSIVKPIVKLKRFALSVGKGDLDQKILIESNDEIGSLSKSFQQMVNDLKHTLEEKTKLVKLAAEAKNEKLRVSELQKRNQELEQFAYISSHDLKAPLVNISSIITMIETNGDVKEDIAFLIDKIKSTVSSMRQKIVRLNEVIKFKKNIKLEATTISFSDHTRDVLKNLEAQISESNADIRTDFRNCDTIVFPSVHLYHILINLISNAIKYRKPFIKPIIEVTTTASEGHICLMVKDNGLGMDLDAYGSKLFGLFQRFHLEMDGDGVGLHIVKNIVESYGGKIQVESKPNEGSTFKVYLT
ncbi:ATP-binding protein [Fulvivirgaceae bacterium BMA10]|uniref:histidine kinase n=1 Tax=Splendidivirga corallicola TaxID=3051826 RepID=A0ABT8KU62_9BACT|nr:ATP-binding protein [Fulvivirgaceae bacterium BMA10]